MNPEDKKPDEKPAEEFVKPMVLGDVRRHRKTDLAKVLLVLSLILALGGGGAAYWWRDKEAKDAGKTKETEITSLKNKVADLEKQLGAGKKDNENASETMDGKPSQSMIDNVKAVFATGNTQPMETYTANPVKVILAASECCGDKSPSEATQEVTAFIEKAGAPWNFSVDAATLAKYRAGSYKEYFPNNAVIGKSGDLVISFSFDNNGKIKTVFMANGESVLSGE